MLKFAIHIRYDLPENSTVFNLQNKYNLNSAPKWKAVVPLERNKKTKKELGAINKSEFIY